MEYKENVDAEGLMPFPTSDFRNPICLEMKLLRNGAGTGDLSGSGIGPGGVGAGGSGVSVSGAMEIGSIDSSDTYASCNTQPFNSQGDLTEDSNLYVNPLNDQQARPGTSVKKSASGDTALRSLGASPMDEIYKGFGGPERGSRGSLNEAPLPKHRKTRFQQNLGLATQPRFDEQGAGRESQESLETKKRRTSFMPSRPLATATRIINQHLFGISTIGKTPAKGKNGESKSSLSVDSIDSRTCPTPETHRRSKSILKKHDPQNPATVGLNHRPNRVATDDPETEKLIPDSMSGSDYSPGKSPPTTLKAIGPLKPGEGGRSHSLKFIGLQQDKPSEVTLLQDLLGSSSLYICPPPPPMEHSPTEETRLLTHRRDIPSNILHTS